MEKLEEIMKSMEDVDETMAPKAFCNVGIQSGSKEAEWEVVDSCNTMGAVVSFYQTTAWIYIDLSFGNTYDPDLIIMTQLCEEYNQLEDACQKSRDKCVSLVVSMTPMGEYFRFIVGRNCAWSLRAKKNGEACTILRLIVSREDFGAYEFPDKTVDRMINEAFAELEKVG